MSRHLLARMVKKVFALGARVAHRLAAQRRARDLASYMSGGQKPWTQGYHVHKENQIRAAISTAQWDPLALPAGHGFRIDERVVEYPWFFSRLPHGDGRLLDAGSILNFDYLLDHPKIREKSTSILTLAPEGSAYWQKSVSYIYGDLRETCLRDGWFDGICCISTLEHVGLDNTMLYTSDQALMENDPLSCLAVVREMRRLLKPGGTLYLSVPFGKAVNHGWFQVFDAAMIDRVIEAFSPSRHSEIIYRYLPDGWVVASRAEAADAEYFDIHKNKTYDPDYAAASRAVVCLELVS